MTDSSSNSVSNNSTNTVVTDTKVVNVTRIGTTHYRATNSKGATLDFGRGEGMLSPVELLLAAVGGCSSVDVDLVTSRRSEPENFDVRVEGTRVKEDGASRFSEVSVAFNVTFPDTPEGQQAQSMVDRLIRLSQEKDCTVSRTVELPTDVTFTNEQAGR